MIGLPERSEARDAALLASLAHVPELGWTRAALRAGLRDIGADPRDADMLFPGGGRDLIETFVDMADRRMAEAAPALAGLRLPARVRGLIAARLAWLRPHREAVRRALALLALPRHAGLAARCTARTVDAIWHAAGDRSADFSWYTKRAILAGVHAGTLLVWLRDVSDDDADTLAFLDRRLEGVARLGRLRKRVEAALPPFRPAA